MFVTSVQNYEAVNLCQLEKTLLEQQNNIYNQLVVKCSKLEFYDTVLQKIEKNELTAFLRENMKQDDRYLIANLLMGTLPLRIETGRLLRIDRCNRICELCQKEIESECHFLFRCKMLDRNHSEVMSVKREDEINTICELLKTPFKLLRVVKNLWNQRKEFLS